MSTLAAIILAAGKGTRMKSSRAKVTFPLAGKPMIQRVVDSAISIDCTSICVVVGFQKDSVIACLDEDDRIQFVEQAEQLGTGHAVMMTEPLLKDHEGDILILSGDVPLLSEHTLKRIISGHRAENASCTVLTAFLDDPGKYGRVLRDAAGSLMGIVEFKDATAEQCQIKEWNTGIYCFRARDLYQALQQISNSNQQKEYYLTDTVSILYALDRKVAAVVLNDLMEVAGVNSQEQLAGLEDEFINRIRRHWLNNGVVIHNPTTVYIDDEVILEPDVEIGQGSILRGRTLVESGCQIGPNCLIEHSRVCNDSILEGYNILVNAHIPEHHIVAWGESVLEESSYE